jgi:hypothetical protein
MFGSSVTGGFGIGFWEKGFSKSALRAFEVYNLCAERSYKPDKFESVAVYPIEDDSVPPLSDVARFCDDVHTFLESNSNNVAVIHCALSKLALSLNAHPHDSPR